MFFTKIENRLIVLRKPETSITFILLIAGLARTAVNVMVRQSVNFTDKSPTANPFVMFSHLASNTGFAHAE